MTMILFVSFCASSTFTKWKQHLLVLLKVNLHRRLATTALDAMWHVRGWGSGAVWSNPYTSHFLQWITISRKWQKLIDMHWRRSRGTGRTSPPPKKIRVDGTPISNFPQSLCLLCTFVHLILWNAVVAGYQSSGRQTNLCTEVWGLSYQNRTESGPGYSLVLMHGPQNFENDWR